MPETQLTRQEIENWVRLLESPQPTNAALALHLLEGFPSSPALVALVAVAGQKWALSEKSLYSHSDQFQANQLGWSEKTESSLGDTSLEIAFRKCVEQHGSPGLWQAAAIFRLAYPQRIPVGNADVGGYEADCEALWAAYQLFASDFEAALCDSPRFVCQFMTVAQVLWAHFRWQPNDADQGRFSLAAAGYFLAKAAALAPPFSVHYYQFFRKLPGWDAAGNWQEGEPLALHSLLGITQFYYAQFCQYHSPDGEKALALYRYFVELEPDFLPDSRLAPNFEDATKRFYPPSIQEAYTEMGRLYRQQNELTLARECFERAIALRPANHAAPYPELAEVYRLQGRVLASLDCLARGSDLHQEAFVPDYFGAKIPFPHFCYDPSAAAQPLVKIFGDHYARARVIDHVENYKSIADTYLYELLDFQRAGMYYRKYLLLCRPECKEEVFESQVRMAMENKDYWQARSLCEKILRANPTNQTAAIYQQRIKKILGY